MSNKGMITVEAAVIIPISLIITILLVWLGFYYYDKNVIASVAAEAAVYGAENAEYTNEEIKAMVEDKARDCLKGRTVLLDDVNSTVTVSYSEIIVELSTSLSLPQKAMFGGIYNVDAWGIYSVKKAPRLKPSGFVRIVSFIKEGIFYNEQ